MYDAIVVGARCAGSPTAMLLARKGYKVLLLDKAIFPSDTMSTHYIHQPGVEFMRKWGVLDTLKASGLPRIRQINVTAAGVSFSPPRPPGVDNEMEAYCPRRTVLDKILVDAAADAGVEVREGFSVKEILANDDRIIGVRGAMKGGSAVDEEARIVIGADGLHSTVAGFAKPEEYNTHPSLSFGYYAYFRDVELEGAELYMMEGPGDLDFGGVLAFPTHNGEACIAAGGPIDQFHMFREDVEGHFLKVLDSAGTLGERVRAGTREERFQGTADQPNFFRKPFGPGWALVGDAGYHRDFVTGLGITDAFRDANLLAAAIDAGLSEQQPLDDALAGYERQRNDIAEPLYEVTVQMVSGDGVEPQAFLAFGAAMQRMMPNGEG